MSMRHLVTGRTEREILNILDDEGFIHFSVIEKFFTHKGHAKKVMEKFVFLKIAKLEGVDKLVKVDDDE